MRNVLARLLAIAIVIALATFGLRLWQSARTAQAYHELALTVSSVKTVTLYDVDGTGGFSPDLSSNELSSKTAVSFPLEVFTSAAGSAEYHQWGLWKGGSLAVLTLRDGSQRHARFSYYGGFFSLEGVRGIYVVKGGQDSEFFRTFSSVIQQQFIPKRPKT